VESSDIVEEFSQQEKTGLFKGARKRKQEIEKYVPTQKDFIDKVTAHIKNALKITGEFKILEKYDRIIIAGTGINATAGDILREYLASYDYKISVNSDFALPDYVDNKTLVFIASFTGNDEEAIMCYKNALRKGCRIVGLSSGGRLLDAFERNNTEHIKLPTKIVESMCLSYVFFPILRVLENSQLIKSQQEVIKETLLSLQKSDLKDMSRALYAKIQDKVPIIYSSPTLAPVAKYWKQQFNLNAKVPAFTSVQVDAPFELNSYVKDIWDFYLIFLRDQDDSKELVKSISVAKNIIKNKSYGLTEIIIKGSNPLARYFSAAFVAEMSSFFLNQYYNLDEDLLTKYRQDFKKI